MNEIQEELARLMKLGGGILRPVEVVKAAKPKKSPLHDCFEWDDEKAGHEYRLNQARHLIVSVVVVASGGEMLQAHISLKPDRYSPGGGYRAMVDVLSDKELRAQMLAEALAELEVFRRKYKDLKELAGIFAAMKKARKPA